jgi:hypothetical protein
MITPAISVLSAIEGLQIATPIFRPYVVPVAGLVLVVLFAILKRGSGRVGRLKHARRRPQHFQPPTPSRLALDAGGSSASRRRTNGGMR